MESYYASGKLLITGEYFVLDGALALAIPCKFGQRLEIEVTSSNSLTWESLDMDGKIWFNAVFSHDFEILQSSDEAMGIRLQSILKECRLQNPLFISTGAKIQTSLDFPRAWGLGTSSTLVSLLAQLAAIDPFDLYFKTFGGSGYDIACASASNPILYKIENGKPQIKKIDFNPPFHQQLYFVYLGKKQNSREGIKLYQQKKKKNQHLIKEISALTEQLLMSQNLSSFLDILAHHEQLISEFIDLNPVKLLIFNDFDGGIKSLGAWGGDFVLAISSMSEEKTFHYFHSKGFKTVIPYREMIFSA